MKTESRSLVTEIDWGMIFSLGIAAASLTIAMLLIN